MYINTHHVTDGMTQRNQYSLQKLLQTLSVRPSTVCVSLCPFLCLCPSLSLSLCLSVHLSVACDHNTCDRTERQRWTKRYIKWLD